VRLLLTRVTVANRGTGETGEEDAAPVPLPSTFAALLLPSSCCNISLPPESCSCEAYPCESMRGEPKLLISAWLGPPEVEYGKARSAAEVLSPSSTCVRFGGARVSILAIVHSSACSVRCGGGGAQALAHTGLTGRAQTNTHMHTHTAYT
jgi:hypothetical protein